MNLSLMTIGLEPIPPRAACLPPPPRCDDDDEPAPPPKQPARGTKPAAREARRPKKLTQPDGRTKTQRLLDAIFAEGPITTADLAITEGIPSKSIWSLLEHHLAVGIVLRRDGRWHAGVAVDPTTTAAVKHLRARGWTCTPPGAQS